MDVQSINQVLNVEALLADVENLQDESEKRNTEEHHGGEIAPERFDEKLGLGPILADAVLDSLLHPGFKRSFRSILVVPEVDVSCAFLFIGAGFFFPVLT